MRGMFGWLRELSHLVSPELCHGCLADTSASRKFAPFCHICIQKMRPFCRHSCPKCGADSPEALNSMTGCPACRHERFAFTKAWKLGPHEGLIREIVLKGKQARGESLAEAAGWLLAQFLNQDPSMPRPDAVVPVPVHWIKRLFRGHNAAHGLAIGLSRAMCVPCQGRWLWKTRPTPSQTSLTPSDRRTSPRGAFRAHIPPNKRGGAIWLVDDVLTTGATASACAQALLNQGAREVVAVVLARGG